MSGASRNSTPSKMSLQHVPRINFKSGCKWVVSLVMFGSPGLARSQSVVVVQSATKGRWVWTEDIQVSDDLSTPFLIFQTVWITSSRICCSPIIYAPRQTPTSIVWIHSAWSKNPFFWWPSIPSRPVPSCTCPFLRCLKHACPDAAAFWTTAQFGVADLCGPKNIARQINEMTWGLKRWDLTIQTGSDQIRRVEGWRNVFMRSSHSTNFRGKVHFFRECSKPLEHGHDRRFFPNSMIVEVVVEIWAKHLSPSNLVDLLCTASGRQKELI